MKHVFHSGLDHAKLRTNPDLHKPLQIPFSKIVYAIIVVVNCHAVQRALNEYKAEMSDIENNLDR
jgi:hypothetical protein